MASGNIMRVLFIGDSITRGVVGASFFKLLKKQFPSYSLKNLGVDGDTFSNITKRLFDEIAADPNYDCVVIQGGYNDIFLPYFFKKGRLFQFALSQQLKKGLKPITEAQDFERHLRETVINLKKVFAGKIILATMGCINEYQSFELNSKRSIFNTIIKSIAHKENVALADCGSHFDSELGHLPQRNYFLESFWAITLTDRAISQIKKGPGFLSNLRKLNLTIDGAHLNSKGAKIFADCIAEAIRQPQKKISPMAAAQLRD